MLLHERGVVAPCGDHAVQEAQRESRVAGRAVLQPEIGRAGLEGALGVDHDQLRAGAPGGDDAAPQQRRRGARPHPPDDHAARDPGCGCRKEGGAEPVGQRLAHRVRPVADFVLPDAVRAPEEIHEALAQAPFGAVQGAEGHRDRFRAVALDEFPRLLRDVVESLVPPDFCPLPRAAGPDPLARTVHATGGVVELVGVAPLRTDEAPTHGMRPVPVDRHDALPFPLDEDSALLRAGAAHGSSNAPLRCGHGVSLEARVRDHGSALRRRAQSAVAAPKTRSTWRSSRGRVARDTAQVALTDTISPRAAHE